MHAGPTNIFLPGITLFIAQQQSNITFRMMDLNQDAGRFNTRNLPAILFQENNITPVNNKSGTWYAALNAFAGDFTADAWRRSPDLCQPITYFEVKRSL